jgi:hypothetical protein
MKMTHLLVKASGVRWGVVMEMDVSALDFDDGPIVPNW